MTLLLAAILSVTCVGNPAIDTPSIQAIVDQATAVDVVQFDSPHCRVNPTVGIRLTSDKRLELGTTLIDIGANAVSTNRVFQVVPGSQRISIRGGIVRGSRVKTTGMTSAHWGIGVHVDRGSFMLIEDVRFEDWYYDGIYIGGNNPGSHSVHVRNVTVTGSRRNGMSIANGDLITIQNSIFENTNGDDTNMPRCGIDVEPNASTEKVTRLRLIDNVFRNNQGSGVFVQHPHAGRNSEFVAIGNRFEQNGRIGLIVNTTDRSIVAYNSTVGGNDGISLGASATSLIVAYNDVLSVVNRSMIFAGAKDPIVVENNVHGGRIAVVGITWPPVTGVFINGVYGHVWMRENE
jgi:hypothetical protein